MTPYIPIAGTHEARLAETSPEDLSWISPGSLFDRWVSEHLGWERRAAEFRFWSTELAGSLLCSGGSKLTWSHGGDVLASYLGHPGRFSGIGQPVIVIAHSHGGQVAAFAAAKGGQIPVLVTVDSPVRPDMAEVWADARPNIGLHIHLYGTGLGSAWRVLGAGLWAWQFRRTMPWADHNVQIAGGHRGILRDARHLSQWRTVADLIESERGRA